MKNYNQAILKMKKFLKKKKWEKWEETILLRSKRLFLFLVYS